MPFNSIDVARDAGFPTSAEGADLTLTQINKLADIYDDIEEAGTAETPMLVAWTQWKKLYTKTDGRWVEIKESAIRFAPAEFVVASERSDGIPEHAIEIEGPLIEIGKKNLADWGVNAGAVGGIIERGIGIPILMCNDPNPHACDLNHDRYADIGYVTRLWEADGWVKARAAITKRSASESIEDGTWTPFGAGNWSVSGYPAGDKFDDSGMLDGLLPMAISLVPPPSKPAYAGSGFAVVAAAVRKSCHTTTDDGIVSAAEWTTAYINDLPDSAFAYVETCYDKTSDDKRLRHLPYRNKDGNIDLPHLRNALARVSQIKMTCEADLEKQDTIITTTQKKLRKLLDEATKTVATASMEEPKVTMAEMDIDSDASGAQVPAGDAPPVAAETTTPEIVTPPHNDTPAEPEPEAEIMTYTQEALDKAVEIALEKQKAEYDAQMAKMTPTADINPMFASFKKELNDERARSDLVDRYAELVTASKVLSAPLTVNGKIDQSRLDARKSDMMKWNTASVEQAVADAEAMVAAMPTRQTPFDAAAVPSRTPETGIRTGFTVGGCKGGDD
jgi:hypothetical protein